MRAARYRLRYRAGVTLPAVQYGGGEYGSLTYGQQATDPIAEAGYSAMPWPGGFLSSPGWLYRQGDTHPPFEALVLGGNGIPLDFTSSLVSLVLTPYGNGSPVYYEYGLVLGASDGFVIREWEDGDLDHFGVYRAVIVTRYDSGRRLTIPAADHLLFVVTQR